MNGHGISMMEIMSTNSKMQIKLTSMTPREKHTVYSQLDLSQASAISLAEFVLVLLDQVLH